MYNKQLFIPQNACIPAIPNQYQQQRFELLIEEHFEIVFNHPNKNASPIKLRDQRDHKPPPYCKSWMIFSTSSLVYIWNRFSGDMIITSTFVEFSFSSITCLRVRSDRFTAS